MILSAYCLSTEPEKGSELVAAGEEEILSTGKNEAALEEGEKILRLGHYWLPLKTLLAGSHADGPSPFESFVMTDAHEEEDWVAFRLIEPERVNEIASAFRELSADLVDALYDPDAMSEHERYFEHDGPLPQTLKTWMTEVKEFYSHAAKHRHAVVQFMDL